MNVTVIGTGYVGLVAGACLAELGHHVVCVDKDADKIAKLEQGELPIYEPGLEDIVPRNVREGRLSFTTETAPAVRDSEVVFIAVGTPPGEDGSADLQYVIAVAESIADALNDCKVVVVKSTVPIGSNERVRAIIASRSKEHFDVVSNPEFLREGVAVQDFLDPDRIVLGTQSDQAREVMERLYKPLTDKGAELLVMDIRSAELTKYASNAMLATRISFMNEIALLCDRVGANVEAVRSGMGTDSRIGPAFLRADVGYGGSCFPKDVQALLRTAHQYDLALQILEGVEEVNFRQKRHLVEVVLEEMGPDLSGMHFALWGLAFKPDTDYMREAPAITIVRGLVEAGATVSAFDPVAHETARTVLGEALTYADDPHSALEGADALILATEWGDFREPDWDRVSTLMRGRRIYDGRNLWDPSALAERGFTYRGIGRR